MIIVLEGPEKAGKSTLANRVLSNFQARYSRLIKCDGRDKYSGMGYLDDYARGIDSHNVEVWDRAWIGEYVYGKLLGQPRRFAEDPFLAEWIYGRPMIGRGGKFVVMPYDYSELYERRDETDVNADAMVEAELFVDYANRWGYELLFNDYTPFSLMHNRITAQRSVFLGLHGIESRHYVGPKFPALTFVDAHHRDSHTLEGLWPLANPLKADSFRPFGDQAVLDFGYTSLASLNALERIKRPRQIKALLKRPILVVEPGLPVPSTSLPVARMDEFFIRRVNQLAKEYGICL